MKIRKRFPVLTLAAAIFLMTGCGNNAEDSQSTPSTDTSEVVSTETATSDEDNQVVATKDFPTDIAPIEDYEEAFPEHVHSFEKNSEEEKTTYGGSVPIDYLEEYPYLITFYKGYGFEKQYDRARGHIYALEDVENTKRPKAGASCLACKVSIFNEELVDDPTLAAMDFDEYVNSRDIVGFTCFDCHRDTPGTVQINRQHLKDYVENNNPAEDYLSGSMLACAQCHVEYYMTPDEKMVTLPWSNGLGAEEAYAYYQENDFYDWEHELTGAKVLKVQHPETETFYGSVHQMQGLDCLTCHMPQVEEDGEKISSHHWTSPLKTPEESCLQCHKDQTADEIVKLAESIQKPVVEKTDSVGNLLEAYIKDLQSLIESGNLDDETKTKLQDIQREAQFYWDYVFVENSEGFHNQKKALEYLDHSEELINQGQDLIKDL